VDVLVLNADHEPLHRVSLRHADRTPAEAGMRLRITPAAPTWASLAR